MGEFHTVHDNQKLHITFHVEQMSRVQYSLNHPSLGFPSASRVAAWPLICTAGEGNEGGDASCIVWMQAMKKYTDPRRRLPLAAGSYHGYNWLQSEAQHQPGDSGFRNPTILLELFPPCFQEPRSTKTDPRFYFAAREAALIGAARRSTVIERRRSSANIPIGEESSST